MDGLVQEYSCTRVQYSSTRVSISLIRSPVRYFDTTIMTLFTRVLEYSSTVLVAEDGNWRTLSSLEEQKSN
jgi:hypothetical protein